jgi:hypothetical protein
MAAIPLDAAAEARRSILANAKPNTWIALSADERRVVAEADTFAAVAELAEQTGESDPLILFIPEDWSPRAFVVAGA